jgi:2-polyprenyl-3-methyl-5-hydroxy-6-metoxy-1,4-benzoquinol methylase
MPRIKQKLALTLASNLNAFLRLDAGIGRRVPGNPEELLKVRDRQVRAIRQRLQKQMRRFKQKTKSEAHLSKELQREKERRQALKKQLATAKSLEFIESSEFRGQTHALPDPDESINRERIFRSMISHLKPGNMLDLGTGNGKFALVAAHLGWKVTAVDARTVRIPEPEQEKDPERAELIKSVEWIESDLREFPIQDGEYDLICVLGLLHHLEIKDQLGLLRGCSKTLTILGCRVAPEIVVTEGPYEGFYHREPGETRGERDQMPEASWGNEASFLHTEESLIRLLRDCGYEKVMSMRPPHQLNYTFYLGLPVS